MKNYLRFVGGLTLACLVIVGGGCSRRANVADLLASGERSLERGDLKKALLAGLGAAEASGKTNAQALKLIGGVFLEQGNLGKAWPVLATAAQTLSNDVVLQMRLGKALLGARDGTNAAAALGFVLSRQPTNGQAYLLLVEAAQLMSTNRQPIKDYLRSKEAVAGQVAGYQVALGNLAMLDGQTNVAGSHFARALALDPKEPSAHLGMAEIARIGGDRARADEEAGLAAKLAPIRSGIRLRHVAYLLTEREDVKAAKKQLEAITEAAPDYLPALMLRARLELAERRYDECAATLDLLEPQIGATYETRSMRGQLELGRAGSLENTGDAAGSAKSLERAWEAFSEMVAKYTNSFEPLYYRAVAGQKLGKREEPIGDLRQAIQLAAVTGIARSQQAQFNQAMLLLAELRIARGDGADSLQLLKGMAEKADPKNEALLLQYARLQVQARLFEEAIRTYERLAKANTNDARFPFLIGGVRLIQAESPEVKKEKAKADGYRADARKQFQASLVRQPDYLPALAALVTMDEEAGKFAEARQRLEQAIKADSKSAALPLLLADVFFNEAKAASGAGPDRANAVRELMAGAEKAAQQALERSPDSRAALLLLARIQVATGRQNDALTQLKSVLGKNPRDVRALLQTALIQSELGNHAAARDAYEQLIEVQPGSVEALNNLAYLYSEQLKDLDRALKYAQAAAQAAGPRNPYVTDTLGWVHFRRGEYAKALEALQSSVRTLESAPVDPDAAPRTIVPPEIRYHLGMTHYMLGNEVAAKAQLKEATSGAADFPGRAEALASLKTLEIAPQNVSKAQMSELEARLAQRADDPVVLIRLATAHEQAGNAAKAAECYEALRRSSPGNLAAGLRLAQLYAGPLGDRKKALGVMTGLRRQAGNDPQIAWYLGRLYFLEGDFKGADALLEEAARGIGLKGELAYDAAWSAYAVGKETRAQEAMLQATRSEPPLDKALAEQAKQFVELIPLARDPKRALESLPKVDQVLKNEPKNVPALMAAGAAAEQQNRPEAADHYRKVLELYPNFTPAARRLWILDYQKKDYNQAVQSLVRYLRAMPKDGEAQCYLGLSQAGLGQKEQAIETLKLGIDASPRNAPWLDDARKKLEELQTK